MNCRVKQETNLRKSWEHCAAIVQRLKSEDRRKLKSPCFAYTSTQLGNESPLRTPTYDSDFQSSLRGTPTRKFPQSPFKNTDQVTRFTEMIQSSNAPSVFGSSFSSISTKKTSESP